MKSIPARWLDQAIRILWALVLVCLPVTSFRYLPFMGAGTQVRPLSLIPAALLLTLLVWKSSRQRRFLFSNGSLVPLMAFLLVALFSSVAGFFYAPPGLYGISYESRLLRAWVTLAVGLVFFLTAIGMGREEMDLGFTLKWLYIGMAAHVVWSLAQLVGFYIFSIYLNPPYSNIIDTIQRTVMMTGVAPNERISGLALEPSWLAAQVIALYLPWAFASLLKNYAWNQRRWLPILLLLVCIYLLVFTYSRSGILTAVVIVIATLLLTGGRKTRQIWDWLAGPFRPTSPSDRERIPGIALRTVILVGILGVGAAGVFVLSRNEYFATLWQSLLDSKNLVDYFVNIYAGPRLAYAYAGWQVFASHPWTGVGLGGLGLYFHAALPDWAHFNIPEIASLLASNNTVYPNSKNLYIRLLSETGIFGFWLFVSFYLFVLGKILKLLRSSSKELIFIGVAGLCSWFAIVLLGMSQDSLAMPTIWIPLGIVLGLAESRK